MIPPGTPLLLDTNICILLARGGVPAERLESRFGLRSRAAAPWVSVVTVGELLAFAKRNAWGDRKRDGLEQLLGTLIVIDIRRASVLRAYAELDTHLKRSGTPMGQQDDVWIAATAAGTGAVLLTTDRDFAVVHPDHLRREWVDPESLR
ncbi:MAG TPA: type II toxin-antitoxin system VapC family toxin [Longimicrobium sp.]|nr:type II toxin-antitoxin system VapC family toxin [Longimicrobium sp.]